MISSYWPCAMKIGIARFALEASACTFAASGRYVESASTPASASAWRNAACSTMAPPCEKPASTIFFPFSAPIRASTIFCEARIPASSSGPPPNWKMSYQARMRMPLLIVTGRIGACGNTKRTACSSSSSGTIGSKSCPSAPRPCSQITAARGSGPVSISTASMQDPKIHGAFAAVALHANRARRSPVAHVVPVRDDARPRRELALKLGTQPQIEFRRKKKHDDAHFAQIGGEKVLREEVDAVGDAGAHRVGARFLDAARIDVHADPARAVTAYRLDHDAAIPAAEIGDDIRSAHFSHLQHGLYDVHRGGLVAHARRAGVRASGDEESNEKAVHLFFADGGLRAKGLDHRLVGLDVRAANQVDTVGNGGEHPVERLADRLRLPGQVDDERALADHGHLPGKDRGGHVFQAHGAHLLAEPRHHFVCHGERGFRRYIARRRASAARGEDQAATLLVGEFLQRSLDERLLVGDEPQLFAPFRRGDRRFEPIPEGRNAFVLVDAGGRAVADRHQADDHATSNTSISTAAARRAPLATQTMRFSHA